MSAFWDKLNLRPQERRLVVLVAVVVFVVLNVWFIWPLFDDWKIVRDEYEKGKLELLAYQREIARVPSYEAKLKALESEGPNVIPEEQDLDLVRTVQALTAANGVDLQQSDPRPRTSNTQTNQFFEEKTQNVRIEATTTNLVDFLVSLASTNSLIRVQEMSLQPAPSGFKLSGNLTLVASYQKKPPPKPTAPPPPAKGAATAKAPPGPTSKPASPASATKAPAAKGKAAPKAPSP